MRPSIDNLKSSKGNTSQCIGSTSKLEEGGGDAENHLLITSRVKQRTHFYTLKLA